MMQSIMQKPIAHRRHVGMLCPLHKLPLIAGIDPREKQILYICDSCDDWSTAEHLVKAVAIKEHRIADRVVDPRYVRRRVRNYFPQAG